jgi:branched-subunit amino acid permease
MIATLNAPGRWLLSFVAVIGVILAALVVVQAVDWVWVKLRDRQWREIARSIGRMIGITLMVIAFIVVGMLLQQFTPFAAD